MEEKRTAFGRTPTDKAWQELRRHRQDLQHNSTRIMDEIARLEREVATLQAELEQQRNERQVQNRIAEALDVMVARTNASKPQPVASGGTGLILDDTEECEAFDIFFADLDSATEKDRRFLLD